MKTEFQSRSYDASISHIAIIFTKYTVLERILRHTDEKTYGELLFMFFETNLKYGTDVFPPELDSSVRRTYSTLSTDINKESCINNILMFFLF